MYKHCASQDTNIILYLLLFYYNIFRILSMFKFNNNQVTDSQRHNFYITFTLALFNKMDVSVYI